MIEDFKKPTFRYISTFRETLRTRPAFTQKVLPIGDWRLPTADWRLPIANCQLNPPFFIILAKLRQTALIALRFTGKAGISSVKDEPVMGNRYFFFGNVFYELLFCL
jgi:hypothetical protein